ncbi:hypothetical protein UY3_03323 [Chelonia mydas]|uniref:Uncharacterized protein n=1 Tax=Chelonia mydas TaxID=8469 RepID=M7BNH8_CHEMY|nr:hypothetical protein UY3_03323 [Chelonia mydas]
MSVQTRSIPVIPGLRPVLLQNKRTGPGTPGSLLSSEVPKPSDFHMRRGLDGGHTKEQEILRALQLYRT